MSANHPTPEEVAAYYTDKRLAEIAALALSSQNDEESDRLNDLRAEEA